MSDAPQIKFGASLGAWRPSDVLVKLREMAEVAEATTLYPYPWNLPVPSDVLRDIRQVAHDLGLTLLVHGPCWEVYTASVYPQVRALGVDALGRAIDFAAAIGAVHITVHAGLSQWPDVWPHMEREALDAQAQSLLELSRYAAQAGLAMGIENMPAGSGAFQGYIDFCEIFRLLEISPELGVTLDVAHVHTAQGDLAGIVKRLGRRINHVHVTDNHADRDSHLPIGEGTIQWAMVAQALLEIGYQGVVELERSLADGGVRPSLYVLRRTFARLAGEVHPSQAT